MVKMQTIPTINIRLDTGLTRFLPKDTSTTDGTVVLVFVFMFEMVVGLDVVELGEGIVNEHVLFCILSDDGVGLFCISSKDGVGIGVDVASRKGTTVTVGPAIEVTSAGTRSVVGGVVELLGRVKPAFCAQVAKSSP